VRNRRSGAGIAGNPFVTLRVKKFLPEGVPLVFDLFKEKKVMY